MNADRIRSRAPTGGSTLRRPLFGSTSRSNCPEMIVTIDGPAGTGKSTVARLLAKQLGFAFLDTGSMYRMIALRSLMQGIDPGNAEALEQLTLKSRMELVNGVIELDGENVEGLIRTAEVTKVASLVAQVPAVRSELVRRQREIASTNNIVCEGRDQGTVAFPHAECKFFLTAAPEERARRRQAELLAKGEHVDFEKLLQEQTARDQRDEVRSVAPLRPAEDAVIVDTTSYTVDEVVRILERTVRERAASA